MGRRDDRRRTALDRAELKRILLGPGGDWGRGRIQIRDEASARIPTGPVERRVVR